MSRRGTPEDAGGRATALPAQLVEAGESDARRARVRSVEALLEALNNGEPVTLADRIAVLNATLLGGSEAGFVALREAESRAASDPELLAANAWVGVLIEMLVTARSPREARGHIA